MANDLVTRLTLNNKDFENNLSKSTQQIKNFKKQSEDQSKAIKAAFSGIAKAAGGIGIAFSVMEGVNKTIDSSQKITDELGRSVTAAKSSVDYFFSSLTRGDFTGFIDGLGHIITQAGKAYDALDALGSFNIYNDTTNSELEYLKEVQRTIIKDKKSSDTEKINAQNELLRLQKLQLDNAKQKSDLELNAYNENLKLLLREQKILNDNQTAEEQAAIMKQFATYEYYDELIKRAEEITEKLKGTGLEEKDSGFWGLFGDGSGRGAGINPIQQISDEQKALQKELQEILKVTEIGDEKLKEAFAHRSQYYKTLKEIELEKQKDNKLLGSSGSTGSGLNGTFYLEPDTSDIDDQMLSIQNKLNQIPLIIPVLVEEEEVEDVLGQLAEQQDQFYKNQLQNINNNVSALNSMVSCFDSLSMGLSKAGSEMGAWAATSIGTIIDVIAQYAALQAQALAAGVAQQAGLPFPYNLAAAASTVGGIISIIASIPKFESGGIVGGSSFYGDNVIARVNSGEMILNKKQQSNLFNMLESGNYSNGGSRVDWRISGSDLVGVINNYSKKKGKTL